MHNNFSYYIMFAYIFFLQMSHEKQEKIMLLQYHLKSTAVLRYC